MSARTKLRDDFDADGMRSLARASKDAAQTRRLLALASIYDGGSHLQAARIGGVIISVRAAQNGRSMGSEARALIAEGVETPARPPDLNLADAIHRRFAPFGGVELELLPRQPVREPPTFE